METKTCSNCKKDLDISNFSYRYKRNGCEKKGYSSYCKQCHAEYRKKHYLANKGKYVNAAVICNAKKTNKLRRIVFEYFKTHPCVDCDESDPIVLEFDHKNINEKVEAISKLISRRVSEGMLMDEIKKCDVRCANCHRKRTAKQFNWYASLNGGYEDFVINQKRPRRSKKMINAGKWGYYPCDLETYHKLKKLNMAYTKALHEKSAWDRWDRKEPQNRVIRAKLKNSAGRVVGYQAPVPMPEPELTSIFCKKVVKKVTWGKKGQYYKDGKEETFVELTDLPIFEDYWKARYPVAGKEGVDSLSMKEDQISEIFQKIG